MPGMKLQVTTAGRAALVNPAHTGTNAVRVVSVGIATAPFTATAALTAVPGEAKRLSTVGGTVTAADTIHVSIRDESTDVYDCYGFGLYLADGTLLAAYSQAELLLGKAAAAMMLLAVDAVFADIDVQQVTFGATNFTDPAATAEVPGIVELATETEAVDGADRIRAITPFVLARVLNARLGEGAPTAYAKKLLALGTAALFRTALELKSAATRDEGHGNGLNADLLDGKHAAEFAAVDHTHAAPDSGVAAGKYGGANVIPVVTVDKMGRVITMDTAKVSVTDVDGVLPIKSGGTGAKTHADARTALGLGTAAVRDIGSSGVAVPLLSEINVWGADQRFPSLTIDGADIWLYRSSADGGASLRTGSPGKYHKFGFGADGIFSAAGEINAGTHLVAAGYMYANGGVLQVGSATGSWITLNYNGEFSKGISVNGAVSADRAVLNSVTPLQFLFANGTAPRVFLWGPNGYGDDVGSILRQGVSNYRLDWNGPIFATGGFQPSSSRKFKTAFRKNPYGLHAVLQLETTLGKYRKRFNKDGRERVFHIAENIAQVMPQVAATDGTSYALEQMVAVHTKAIQDLHALVAAQAAELAQLTSTH